MCTMAAWVCRYRCRQPIVRERGRKLMSTVQRLAPWQGRAWRGWQALALSALAATLSAAAALAQSWPERNITLIVPFAAGGASDVSSRIMAEAMTKLIGQSIVIENAVGAGGATGSLQGKNCTPGGYTIRFALMGAHAAFVCSYPK